MLEEDRLNIDSSLEQINTFMEFLCKVTEISHPVYLKDKRENDDSHFELFILHLYLIFFQNHYLYFASIQSY